MYPVSNDYLTKIVKNNRITRITGTLTLKNGTVVQIKNEIIAKAPSITNQCVNNSELKLGQAYQAQLNMSIYSDIDRYLVHGATIRLSFGLELDDGWEEVPLGVYIISECIRTSNDVLQITALDEMDKLDDNYSGDQISGTPFSILNYIATQHGMTLAQHQNEIAALPNGFGVFNMPNKYRSSTWRDVVGDIAAVLAGNAIIDRSGKLFIQSFATGVTRNMPASMRSKEKISDYKVSYSSVSCIKGDSLFSVGTENAQEISLDDNDFLQLVDNVEDVLTNILNAVNTIEYTPSDISWFGDPALDLGDLINATGGAASSSTLIPVQKFKWTWRGAHQISAVGKNPILEKSESLTDKRITKLSKKTKLNEVVYYTFVNIDAVSFISEVEISIAKLRFASAQKTTIKIFHEFIFDMISDLSVDGSYEIRYYFDDELIAYSPYERIKGVYGATSGNTELSICRDFYYILRNVEPNRTHIWEVKIITHGINSTTIDMNHAHITMEGQNLYSEADIGGYLEAEDEVTLFDIGFMEMVEIEEGTGSSEPKVIIGLVTGYILTEAGDVLNAENGDRLITNADTKISDLPSASAVNSDAEFPITQKVNGTDTTLKANIEDIGDYIAGTQTFAGLNTTAKNLIGAINEILANQ